MPPLWARVQDITGEQDPKEGPQGPRVPGWTGPALPSSQPRPAHKHLSLLQSEPTLHTEARTVITASPLRPLPRLTPSAHLGPPAGGHTSQCWPRGHHHWPSPSRSYCLPRCPLLFSPWSSAIALLSGTPTLGSILRTPGPFQADACEDVCPSRQTPG